MDDNCSCYEIKTKTLEKEREVALEMGKEKDARKKKKIETAKSLDVLVVNFSTFFVLLYDFARNKKV